LEVLNFNTRTAAVNFYCVLFQLSSKDSSNQVIKYFCDRQERIFDYLCEGCANEEIAAHASIALQSCLKHDQMVKAFLDGRYIFRLLKLVQHPHFETSTDAFFCLREVLVTHKVPSATWLLVNFDEFFREYEGILRSGSYVVQRQALSLLSELLLDRCAMNVMIKYVNNDKYLRTIMNLLRSQSRTMAFETFQLFKLFAANPKKSERVRKILTRNQLGLIELIDNLQPKISGEDVDNTQFFNDKKNVIDKLQALAPEPEPLSLEKVKLSIDEKNTRKCSKSDVSTAATSTAWTDHDDCHDWCRCTTSSSATYTDIDRWAVDHSAELAERRPLSLAR
jgi:calcium binding protein 39